MRYARDYSETIRWRAPDNPGASDHSMVLMVRDGHDTDFFVLSRGSREGQYFYSLRAPWLREKPQQSQIYGSGRVPCMTLNVVTCGVPMPLHGSLLGWGAAPITAIGWV